MNAAISLTLVVIGVLLFCAVSGYVIRND